MVFFCAKIVLYQYIPLVTIRWRCFPLNVSSEQTKLMGHRYYHFPLPVVGPSLDNSPSGRELPDVASSPVQAGCRLWLFHFPYSSPGQI